MERTCRLERSARRGKVVGYSCLRLLEVGDFTQTQMQSCTQASWRVSCTLLVEALRIPLNLKMQLAGFAQSRASPV